MAGRKIAILGGSFNPVHYGHIEVARGVVNSGLASEVWLSLSPRNPFKEQAGLMDVERRLELLKSAVETVDNVEWTDVELSLPVPSYMIDALNELKLRNPGNDFKLVVGSDNLRAFTQWKNWREILSRYGLIVYPRDVAEVEIPAELRPYKDNITILSGAPLLPISSTEIRRTMKEFQQPGKNA